MENKVIVLPNGADLDRIPPHSGQEMDRKVSRRYPLWVTRLGLGLSLLIGLSLFWIFLAPQEGQVLAVNGEQLTIAPVVEGQFEDFIPIRARVTPEYTVYLDSIEGGRVEEILVEEGAVLKAGDLVLRLSNAGLQLDAISREAQVTEQINNAQTLELQLEQNRIRNKRDVAEAEYQTKRLSRIARRQRSLIAKGHISVEDFEATEDELAYWQTLLSIRKEAQDSDARLQKAQLKQIQSSVAQLQANLQIARANLEKLNVRAPISGQLTAFDLELGQSIAQGERLGQIDDQHGFKLVALVDEFYISRIAVGQLATTEFDDQDFEMRVTKIYPQVHNGQFEVDLIFTQLSPENLRRGQNLQSQLSLSDPSPALLLPNGSFFQASGGRFVFVVDGSGAAAQRRDVRLGRRNTRFVEVLDGLNVGERVITSSYDNYRNMMRLEFEG